jgi:TrmH family RNA methyltransferase
MINELSKKQQKLIKGLRQSKNIRIKNRCFFVEGLKNVAESIGSDYDIRFIVASEGFLELNAGFINKLMGKIPSNRLFQVSDRVFKELAATVTPQGILAVINFKDIDIESIPK